MTQSFDRFRLGLASVSGALVGLGWNLTVSASLLTGGGYALVLVPAGGGGISTGDGLELIGALPGPLGGQARGGDYTLLGGVVRSGEGTSTLPPRVRARLTEDKLAELTWDEDLSASGYILEFSPVLGPGETWQPTNPQPTGTSFLTPCQQPARFFRLRRP